MLEEMKQKPLNIEIDQFQETQLSVNDSSFEGGTPERKSKVRPSTAAPGGMGSFTTPQRNNFMDESPTSKMKKSPSKKKGDKGGVKSSFASSPMYKGLVKDTSP